MDNHAVQLPYVLVFFPILFKIYDHSLCTYVTYIFLHNSVPII